MRVFHFLQRLGDHYELLIHLGMSECLGIDAKLSKGIPGTAPHLGKRAGHGVDVGAEFLRKLAYPLDGLTRGIEHLGDVFDAGKFANQLLYSHPSK